MIKHVTTPLTPEVLADLQAGDQVALSGVIYTARDKAHKLLVEALERGEDLPVDLRDQLIYYVGPAPAKPGQVIGSCGPTTSGRMDAFAPTLLDETGLKGMLGKGPRDGAVAEAIQRNGAVYLVAVGGAGALLSASVQTAEVIAYPELGPEAIYRLQVVGMACIVAQDQYGGDLFATGRATYARSASEIN